MSSELFLENLWSAPIFQVDFKNVRRNEFQFGELRFDPEHTVLGSNTFHFQLNRYAREKPIEIRFFPDSN